MDKEVCAQAPSGFDAIFAAAGHSQLAGVLAAVVFTAIILLLSDRTSPPPDTMVPTKCPNSHGSHLRWVACRELLFRGHYG
jgi:hypothetical protein